MALVSGVGEQAFDLDPDGGLDLGDDGLEGVAVIRIAGQRLGVERELAALRAFEGGCQRDLDADLWTTPALQVGF